MGDMRFVHCTQHFVDIGHHWTLQNTLKSASEASHKTNSNYDQSLMTPRQQVNRTRATNKR